MKAIKMSVLFAVIGMMLATSCSNDEFDERFENETPVTFSLGLENAMSTRAISDGSGVDKLIYAVFDKEGNRVAQSDDSAEFPFEKTISLVKGEQYTAVFWAQNGSCDAYTISEDYKTITVNYDGALNNDETRDAFFKFETFTAREGMSLNVILKRPFAQVNMGVTQADWQNAAYAGFEITKSSVEIKQAATTLNLVNGLVGSPVDVTFAVNAIPANDKLIVDLNCDGESEEYKYLSMCYFLANDSDNDNGAKQTTLDGLKFVLSSEDGTKTLTLQDGLANAPVQRNYRTNIVGSNILTEDIDVRLTVDCLYDGEHTLGGGNVWETYAGIFTEEALAGKTIEIPGDWHIKNGAIYQPMPENWSATSTPLYTKPYTIDGKGHTITFEPYGYSFVTKTAFAAADGQLVTVKNITFAGEHFGIFGGVYGGVSGRIDYNTLFENVNIIDNGIYCYNSAGSIPMSAFSNLGTATLENCTITGTYWVGTKDPNTNAQQCYDNFGIYDIFVPNNKLTQINNSTIGRIYVNNHGHLTVAGTSTVDVIEANALVKGHVTIDSGANVSLVDVDQLSDSYAPTVNIKAGATVETLNLNLITNTTKITIEDGANITKIIHKGVEYSSVADFKASL